MRRRLSMLLTAAALLAGCVLAATGSAAAAATLTVNTTLDGLAPGPGLCSLREAIQAIDSPGTENGNCAAADFGANTIVLGRGIYRLTQPDASGTELTIAPTVTSLTIAGAGEGATLIAGAATAPTDGGSGSGDRILAIPAGPAVTISDVTITGGQGSSGDTGTPGYGATAAGAGNAQPAGTGQPGGDGGAILNAGSLALLDAAITDSHAGVGGAGGNSSWPSPGYPGLAGGTGGRGGDGGAIFNTGTLTLNGVTLADDTAGAGGAGGNGGAGSPAAGAGGDGGNGGDGGALANAGGSVTVTASTIRGDSAGAGGSGAIGGSGWAGASSSAAASGGAGGPGGSGAGVWSSGGTLTITNSTFVSDTAGGGGAGGTGGQAGGPAGAGGPGGSGGAGAVVVAGSGAGLLHSATLVGNAPGVAGTGGAGGPGAPSGSPGTGGAAGAAGGLAGDSTVPVGVQDTLLALNLGGNCGGAVADLGHDLSFRDASCPATFAAGDPRLGSLASNGGPADTVSLRPGSAAIDQVPPSGAGCPATDERGVSRPAGAACDIGAYEVAPPSAITGAARPTAAGRESIRAVVTPNAGQATLYVEYRTGRGHRLRSRTQTVSGVRATAALVPLRGLRPGRTYRYRVVVVAPDGTSTGAQRTFTAPVPAVVSALRVAPAVFARGGSGTSIAYRDTQAAVTTFSVLRRARRGWTALGTFRHRDRRGANRVRFGGRVRGRRLAPGQYRLRATPRSHGLDGRGVTVRFTIRR